MGYTHYWNGQISSETSQALLKDTAHLLSTYHAHPPTTSSSPICGRLGTGDPTLTSTVICLNGDESEGQAHEPFELDISGAHIRFRFCKTARKHYDDVVCAVLLRCLYYNPHPAFEVSSDGSWEEWNGGRELYFKAFGVEAVMPETMTPSWG
ncbi:hypothetical protein TWF718_000823 [Orbilia javanica]|uniref:Uncharacterized protein n=1 Tax=Orbilia javanica TaxID=47235 RepID=A0AAN8NGG4_9PEZI